MLAWNPPSTSRTALAPNTSPCGLMIHRWRPGSCSIMHRQSSTKRTRDAPDHVRGGPSEIGRESGAFARVDIEHREAVEQIRADLRAVSVRYLEGSGSVPAGAERAVENDVRAHDARRDQRAAPVEHLRMIPFNASRR